MSELLKVDGYAGIVKDTRTGAVLSSDLTAFESFKIKKRKAAEADLRITTLENKLSNIETMLAQILGKL